MNEITKELLEALKELLAQTGINGSFADNAKAEAILAASRPDDGWIPWKGGECPIDKESTPSVRFRDGAVHVGHAPWPAKYYDWSHTGDPGDIVAYQVVKP